MTDDERTAVIDECIQAALSLLRHYETRERREQEAVDTITGAACFRMALLKPENAKLRAKLAAIEAEKPA